MPKNGKSTGKARPSQQRRLTKTRSNTRPNTTTKTKTKPPKTKPIDWTLSTPIERDSAVAIRERLAKIAQLMDKGYDFNTAKRIIAAMV